MINKFIEWFKAQIGIEPKELFYIRGFINGSMATQQCLNVAGGAHSELSKDKAPNGAQIKPAPKVAKKPVAKKSSQAKAKTPAKKVVAKKAVSKPAKKSIRGK